MKNYFFVAILLLSLSCHKNVNEDIVTIVKPDIKTQIVTSFKGNVLDEEGIPVANALVEIGEAVTTTSSIGKFEFRDIEVSKESVLIRASKNGFFLGSSTVTVQSQVLTYASISLLDKGTAHTFSGAAEEAMDIAGLQLKIPANSLVDKNNIPYQGEVSAYAKYLSPEDEKFADLMPGELIGFDESGEKFALSALGILKTEFSTSTGELLALAADKQLDITFPLTPEAQALVPQTGTPVWYFNYELGFWSKDDGSCSNLGVCTGNGGTMGVCIPFEAIKISGQVEHYDGTPAGAVIASLVGDDNFYRFRWMTDSLGHFETYAPINMVLDYSIEDRCLNTMHQNDVGGFMDDVILDDVKLDSIIETYEFIVSGTALKCDLTPIVNALIEIRFPGNRAIYYTDEVGAFSVLVNFPCSSFPEITVTAYDLLNKKKSAGFFIDVESDIEVGELVACEEPEDFVEINYNDTTYFLFPCFGKYMETLTPSYHKYHIISKVYGGYMALNLSAFSDTTTTTDGNLTVINFNGAPTYFTNNTNDIDINITENTDNFYIGNFNGFFDSAPVSGVFKSRK